LKKPAGSDRIRFYNKKTKKTEPNRTETDKKPETKPSQTSQNRAKPEKPSQTEKTEPKPEKTEPKPEKTEPNRFEPVFAQKNRTEPKPVGLTRFRFFFQKKKNSVWLLFLIKTEPNQK